MKRRGSRGLNIPPATDDAQVLDLSGKRTPESVGVSISLKHYRPQTQCFSDWEKRDLKRFSDLVEKLRRMTVRQVRENSQLCDRHREQRKPVRYSRPPDVSPDASFFELKVDAGNTSRIHGVFEGPVFHLVHLDLHHEALKG